MRDKVLGQSGPNFAFVFPNNNPKESFKNHFTYMCPIAMATGCTVSSVLLLTDCWT